MNVLITGASGFIGGHITDALIKDKHHVSVCVRNAEWARNRWPGARVHTVDFSKDQGMSEWLARLSNIDVVINAVGIIRETASQRFRDLHTEAPCALFKACEQAGVARVIQISALGADESAFSHFHLSKRSADECLMGLDLNWTILMPSIVYGPGAKSMAFFRALAALPLTPIVDRGDQPIQPIHVDDLVRAVRHIIEQSRLNRSRIELVGPEAISIRDIHACLRQWLGLGKARFISISYRSALAFGYVAGFLGNTPLTKASIQMLQQGNTADVSSFVDRFGFIPMRFEDYLQHNASQQADRWHAAVYFLKPLLRLSIAFLWIFTGVVSGFVYPEAQSYTMLEKAGITGLWAPVMLYGAAFTDLALGMATLVAYRIRLTGMMQIALIMLYSVIISFSQPELWLHPFGPVTKNIPLIATTLVMMALEQK